MNTIEVIGFAQFAGRVASKCQFYFVCRNAAPVVADLNLAPPVTLNADANIACSGIQRVFKQFFHYCCRTLDYFTRRDLSDDIFRENLNRHSTCLSEERFSPELANTCAIDVLSLLEL